MLKIKDGKRAREFRCAFHGWAWNTDGSLKEVPCHWDFPDRQRRDPQPAGSEARPLGRVPVHQPGRERGAARGRFSATSPISFRTWLLREALQGGARGEILRCNWKIAQEAFSEAYHVIATHPTILESIGDANTQYDVFGNYSRAMSPNFTAEPARLEQAVSGAGGRHALHQAAPRADRARLRAG